MTADPARVWLKSWPARHAPNGPGSGRAPTRLVTAPSSTSTRGTQCLLILPRSAIPSPPAARTWRDPAVAHALRAARDNPRIAPEVAAQLPWALRTVTAGSPSSLGLFAAAGYAGPGATGLLGLLGHRTRSQAFAAELVVAAASSIGHGAPTQTSVRPWILTAGTAGSISGSANSDSNRCGTRWRCSSVGATSRWCSTSTSSTTTGTGPTGPLTSAHRPTPTRPRRRSATSAPRTSDEPTSWAASSMSTWLHDLGGWIVGTTSTPAIWTGHSWRHLFSAWSTVGADVLPGSQVVPATWISDGRATLSRGASPLAVPSGRSGSRRAGRRAPRRPRPARRSSRKGSRGMMPACPRESV